MFNDLLTQINLIMLEFLHSFLYVVHHIVGTVMHSLFCGGLILLLDNISLKCHAYMFFSILNFDFFG